SLNLIVTLPSVFAFGFLRRRADDLAGLSINEGEEQAWQFHDGSDMQPELFDLCLISDLGKMGYLFRFYNRVDIDRVVKGAS
ncbi:hypothetical protein Godav_005686, partial [Gossypium davidsonii]|nr:hypothetical protein [Gossypium davidsonii]